MSVIKGKTPKIIGANNNGQSTPPKAPLTLTIDDYISFDLKTVDEKEIKKDFDKWCKDDSYLNDYNQWDIVKPDKMLIRVYRFEKEHAGGLLNNQGKPLTQMKILPFAKVIKIGKDVDRFQPGDIIALPDNISDIETNEVWLRWQKIMQNERPQPDIPEPEKVVGMILDWRKTSKFVNNKFNPSIDDEFTFLRSEAEFVIKYKP